MKKYLFTITTLMSLIANPSIGFSEDLVLAETMRIMRVNVRVYDLMQALKSKNSDVRENAAEALRNIGPEAREAVPVLIDLLKDENPYVRGSAVKVLGKIRMKINEIKDITTSPCTGPLSRLSDIP